MLQLQTSPILIYVLQSISIRILIYQYIKLISAYEYFEVNWYHTISLLVRILDGSRFSSSESKNELVETKIKPRVLQKHQRHDHIEVLGSPSSIEHHPIPSALSASFGTTKSKEASVTERLQTDPSNLRSSFRTPITKFLESKLPKRNSYQIRSKYFHL